MAKEKCDHCRLTFEELQLVNDGLGNKFCCNGCKQVFHLLHSEGLDEFYQKLGKNTLEPAKIREISHQETDGIYKNYVKTNSDGFNEIFIIIEGIHCAACVWLNEKILFNSKGVIEANINASTNKAKIVWDESEVNLAEIFNKIEAIGYKPYPYDPARAEIRANALRREFYGKLLVGIFATMNIMWIAVALYGGYFTGMSQEVKDILHFAEFILASPVLFYTGSVFFKGAKTAILNRTPNMDLLITTGTVTIYTYSVYAMLSRNGEVYFDSVCMVITFVFIGKYLEILSRKRAVDSLDALSNMVINDLQVKANDKFETKNVNEVVKGEIILINSGDRVLIDGVVEKGNASFDYASLSGESIPVYKEIGDEITSGAICIDGSIEYAAKTNFEGSILHKIINLLENASLKKPKIEKLVNQITGYFSIVIFTIAVLTFLFWFFYSTNIQTAIIVAVSVIIIACPCALGLATPVSTLVGLSAGLKRGIIFKEAKIIETLAKCDTIVFDKTGTLTKSNLKVINFEYFFEFDHALLVALLKSSNHPVSSGVYEFLALKNSNIELEKIKSIPAKGMQASFNGVEIYGGNAKFMNELNIKCKMGEKTEYFFAIDDKVMAKFELEDSIRDDAKSSVKNLAKLGFEIYMLSGDNQNTAKNVAKTLDITNFQAECLPTDKVEFIKNLNKSGKNIIMVGDGINDSPALKAAAVGVCLGSGADVSIDKSDIILINDTLKSLVDGIIISKRTFASVKQNLAFSLLYNCATIPLAVMGYVIPLVAAVSMSLSSIVVVLNSMRIKNIFKGKNE